MNGIEEFLIMMWHFIQEYYKSIFAALWVSYIAARLAGYVFDKVIPKAED